MRPIQTLKEANICLGKEIHGNGESTRITGAYLIGGIIYFELTNHTGAWSADFLLKNYNVGVPLIKRPVTTIEEANRVCRDNPNNVRRILESEEYGIFFEIGTKLVSAKKALDAYGIGVI
jgi:hypothetical protein